VADLLTGLISGVLSSGLTWMFARLTKQHDELRTIYAEWASAAHHMIEVVIKARDDAYDEGLIHSVPIETALQALYTADPARWKKTGIEAAKDGLEKARFKATMSDANGTRAKEVRERTESYRKLHPWMKDDELAAAKKDLEDFVETRLRSSSDRSGTTDRRAGVSSAHGLQAGAEMGDAGREIGRRCGGRGGYGLGGHVQAS
jgi:hypothetical protein